MKVLINAINKVNYLVGLLMGLFVLVLMFNVMYEVIARYFFNAPTIWSMESNQYLFCAMSILAGGYCLLKDGHVRVDILYQNFSPKRKAIVEWCTYPFIIIFCGLLVWSGGQETWDSFVGGRVSDTVLAVPLWPIWLTVPLGGLLLALQVVVRLIGRLGEMKTPGKESL